MKRLTIALPIILLFIIVFRQFAYAQYSIRESVFGNGCRNIAYENQKIVGTSGQLLIGVMGKDSGSLYVVYSGAWYSVNRTVDKIPPETSIYLSDTPGENGWWTSDVQVTLSATDNLSGVKKTEYKVGAGIWKDYTAPFTVTSSATVYYRSEDNAGIKESDNPKEIKIDKTPPFKPEVHNDDCTTDGSQLHAWWDDSYDAESGVVEYQYAIGTTKGGTDIAPWTSVGMSTEVTKTGLSLVLDVEYFFSVKARNGAGLWSPVGSSDGITYQLPKIGVSPDSLTFNAVAGGANPAPRGLSINNPGCGTLNWSVSDDAGWLFCDPLSGDCTDETDMVTASVNISGLTSGEHNATITITATLASNTPQKVSVKITIDVFTLASPNGGEKIKGGSSYNITWNTAGAGIDHIKLLYSTDGGSTYPNTIISSTPDDDGRHEWEVPSINSSTVRVKAIAEDSNNIQLASDTSDGNFIIDSAVPTTSHQLSDTIGENGWYRSDVIVTLTATDNLSWVKETNYRINSGSWQKYTIPFTVTATCTVEYYSTDNVDNIEPIKSVTVKIDKTPSLQPVVHVVHDDGDCTTDGSQLHAWWEDSYDAESEVVEYQYAIGTTKGGTDIVPWTSVGMSTEVIRTGLSLVLGVEYFFSVKARNGAGLWSPVGSSDGITYQLPKIGVSPDSLTFNAVAGGANPAPRSLSITNPGCGTLSWSVSDNAGWLSCAPASGDCTGETDMVTASVNISGLAPGEHNATITITATLASNTPQTVSAKLIITETFSMTLYTPNGGEKVRGGSVYDITWDAAGSGIHHIHLRYSTNSGASYQDIVSNTPDDGRYEWTVPSINSSTVRVKAIAEDASSNPLAEDRSDADFTIDSLAPETGISLSGTPGENGWRISDVQVTLSATDNLSGVKKTEYKVGAGIWKAYAAPFTVTSSATVYYRSEDNAGNMEPEKSTQIKIDKTPPLQPVVYDDGDCTTDGSQLHAWWEDSYDAESGVVEYQYAIGTTPGGTNVVNWTSVGMSTEVTRTGLSLVLGNTYYFSVKARNGAGLWSPVGSSDGITYQLPEIGVPPGSLTFNAVAGGANPEPKSLSITNPGCGTLNWSVSDNAGWLSCAPPSGDCTGETDMVTASVNIGGLTPGEHNATIAITATLASNTPQAVSVKLIITETFSTTLHTPNGGEKVRGGSVYDITWDTAGAGIHHIHLRYSTNSGVSYQDIVSNTPDDGRHEWEVLSINSSTVRVKAIAEDASSNPLEEDESDTDFTIDSEEPSAPVISSPMHPKNIWIRNDSPCFEWTEPSDISGIDCYSYALDFSPGTIPDENCDVSSKLKCYSGLEESEWYFHVRACDGAGNWGQTGHYGPVKVWLYIHVDASASGSDGTPDDPYKCIQDGMDAASGGDTVLVADGEYTGERNVNLDFNGKAITVRSENGPGNCIIDCNYSYDTRGFYFHSGEDSSSVVEGFTIQNGLAAPNYESGGGICCQNSSPTIKGNIIGANSAGKGGGIFCWNSSPTIVNNFIAGNGAPKGGGIYCDAGSAPLIMNNTIIKNQAASLSGGGGILSDDSSLTVTNTILWDNIVSKGPDEQVPQQIYLGGGTVEISYSDIQGGRAGIGGNVSGLIWGSGNIDLVPRFDLSKGLYYIECASPCAGAGTSDGAPVDDIEGNPRPDPPGSHPDMGAYESPCGGGEPVPPELELELELSEGWNLISLCIDPVNSDIDNILAPIADSYASVWTYDAALDVWRRHIPSNPSISDLGSIEAGSGYWIDMHSSDTLPIQGQQIESTAVPLYQGWNMVGYNSSETRSVGKAMSSIADKYSCICTYDANQRQWLRHCVDAPQFLNELDVLEPGVGYIIYAEQACVWVLSP